MRFAQVRKGDRTGIAMADGDNVRAIFGAPTDLDEALRSGGTALTQIAESCRISGEVIDPEAIEYLPPLARASKIICVGLNYTDHAAETSFEVPELPTIFARFNSSLIGHRQALIKPAFSDEFDYEGELVAVVGTGGRNINRSDALDHIAAYSVFNDVSVRDVQMKTPQWTLGKNFDGTGAFGPWLVTADEVPAGARGLHIQTRLNGRVVQDASTSEMVFTVTDLVEIVSRYMTLAAGDILVTGTPAGVGMGRRPPLYMRDGDTCEVDIEGIGVLSNPVLEQPTPAEPASAGRSIRGNVAADATPV